MYGYSYPVIGDEKDLPFYILGIGINEQEYHVIRPGGYCFPQIIYCTKGEGRLLVDGKTYTISPYTAFYLPGDIPHEYYSTDTTWDTHWVAFEGFAVKETLKAFGLSKAEVFKLSDINHLDMIFQKMYITITTDRLFGNFYSSGLLYEFLIEFYRLINSKTPKKNHILSSVIYYIESNYQQNITLKELCEIENVSSQHLCRLFQKHLHMRPMEYIARKRLHEAKSLILTTSKTMNEISKMVGFNNSNYFCILFKRYETMSPGEYRKMMK